MEEQPGSDNDIVRLATWSGRRRLDVQMLTEQDRRIHSRIGTHSARGYRLLVHETILPRALFQNSTAFHGKLRDHWVQSFSSLCNNRVLRSMLI